MTTNMKDRSIIIFGLDAGDNAGIEAVAPEHGGVHIRFANVTIVCDTWDTAFDFAFALVNRIAEVKEVPNADT